MVDNDMPGAWPVWTPGAPLAEFIKRNAIHCYKQNKSSGPCGFGEEDFLCFSHDAPGAGPVWTVCLWELMTPGAGPFLTPGA